MEAFGAWIAALKNDAGRGKIVARIERMRVGNYRGGALARLPQYMQRPHGEATMTKTTIRTVPFDAAEYLDNEASISAFVGDAMESGDPAILQNALNTAARARGMARIAEESGLGRESLYKALRPDAKPQFGTIVKVLGALGVKLVPQPLAAAAGTRGAVAARKRGSVKTTRAKAAAPAKRPSKPRASTRV